jgi:hypothetical protein
MNRNVLFWVLAGVLTVSSAVYQRLTGPTYPVSGTTEVGGHPVKYRLLTSHSTESDAQMDLIVPDTTVRGFVGWKRHKTDDFVSRIIMGRHGDSLRFYLPVQPPAGKLEYQVFLVAEKSTLLLPATGPVVIRFKGEVPGYILYPHILFMFLAMLFSTRAGLEFFSREPKLKFLVLSTVGLLIVGGGILGPIMQKFAFGEYWTGWPFGQDMTDNKTVVALLAWIVAAVALYRSKKPWRWALGAAIILFLVYLIPHSLLGSELDYKALDEQSMENHPQMPPNHPQMPPNHPGVK